MTRDPVGRRGVGTFDSLRRLDTATVLTTILVLGLALRVFIAAFYMPLSGLSNDIGAFNAPSTTTCVKMDSGTVYHFLVPTVIEASTNSPNISRATTNLRYSVRDLSGSGA